MRKSIDVQRMTEHLEDIVFIPDSAHRRAKSKFWHRISDNPHVDTSNLDSAIVAKFCGDQRIHSWWNLPGFQEWFSNQQEYLEKLSYAQMRSIEVITEVLDSGHASDTSKLVAAKMVGDITLRLAEIQGATKSRSGAIEGMSLEQLREFISRSAGRIVSAPTSDSAPTEVAPVIDSEPLPE